MLNFIKRNLGTEMYQPSKIQRLSVAYSSNPRICHPSLGSIPEDINSQNRNDTKKSSKVGLFKLWLL